MRLLCVAGLLFAACGRPQPAESSAPTLGVEACASCHAAVVDSYRSTAHFATSAPASAGSIKGSFRPPTNILQTRSPAVAFRMEPKADGFYQTASDIRRLSTHSERFDVVVGSGRRGQTFLYWKAGILYQLPVSWLAGPNVWINSPGYPDGQIDFGRVIQPRCLECHSTWFSVERDSILGRERYSPSYRLALTCEKCHGDARRHIEVESGRQESEPDRFIYAPAAHSRDQQLEGCALCHSGVLQPRRPAFTWRPGESLGEYYVPDSSVAGDPPDVHGNQVGLLRQSACFRASPDLSCSTCHDVHRTERDLQSFATKCLGCHKVETHPVLASPEQIAGRCVECHMPTFPSRGLKLDSPNAPNAIAFRTHRIAVYPPPR